MDKKLKKLLSENDNLIHTEAIKVVSHVQREQDGWLINTLMLEDVSTPFKFKRKKRYKTLVGQQVNITYYADTESVAGFEIDVMNIVRIKVA
jgi:hypothetical protein